jgi:hypothetical protein
MNPRITTRKLPSRPACIMIPMVAGRASTVNWSGGSAASLLSSSRRNRRRLLLRWLTIFLSVANDFENVRIKLT